MVIFHSYVSLPEGISGRNEVGNVILVLAIISDASGVVAPKCDV